ncbi:hypothetical protein L0B70_11360 [Kaistella sp. 97-N-M2]|uniref:hypothetical protein n=1 Tax=Kaistella sp. 97-N-M2 TaxID=2908645 RepID=UPI001F45AAEA|nr:hypothetical protein [Kaistella sp. 97-N-M2]UJF29427.1 hypothetical protein L0B70_11360 [Kaistella sp. 97-N-M2]
MKRFFPARIICKTFGILVLIVVLGFSSCGIKKSLKQVFNIENISSNGLKTGASCQYTSTSTLQTTQQVAVIRQDFENLTVKFAHAAATIVSDYEGVRKARSVPLYILYQQLRTSLM